MTLPIPAADHAAEVAAGKRFEFGRNWQRFLARLNDDQTGDAERSLASLLGIEDLSGKALLDIGCGSGLFSLAARRLGARVHSLDYDPQAVACATALRDRFHPGDVNWVVEQGSVLNPACLASLGLFDVVYAWGVLHHTGQMWRAIRNAAGCVKADGSIFVLSIYNRHWTSPCWKVIKRLYNLSPRWSRPAWHGLFAAAMYLGVLFTTGQNPLRNKRGMSFWIDVIDWIGGYPYEYATVDQVVGFVEPLGFRVARTVRPSGWTGCNEFVFLRSGVSGL